MVAMRSFRAWTLLLVLLLTASWTAAAGEDLSSVYAAILRGDCDAGQTELSRLRTAGVPKAELERVEGWLDSYRQAVESRADIKARTFEWSVERAREALADGEVYFALSFAEKAAAYAPDSEAYSRELWVQELTAKAQAEALRHAREHHWAKAHAHYTLLTRIHPDDKQLKEVRENAARHGRLEVLYDSEEELQRRIQGVDEELLESAVRLIDRKYYQEPDFKSMAEGALDNLTALAGTQQVYGFLHGLGNPQTREYFTKTLGELQGSVGRKERFKYKDLIKLYNRVAQENRRSVELPEGLLVVEFLEGAVEELDQFTSTVWPVDLPDFEKMMMGGFEGVGIQLGIDEHSQRLKVVTPLEDSPALEAGIQPGDLIVEVDGKSTQGWDTTDAVRNIMGRAGTEVVLTMQRPSTAERIPFTLVRRKIVLRTVRGVERRADDPQKWEYMLDQDAGIAYIRLTGFHPDSHDEVRKALETARRKGMRGLILDLRYNPGGLLDVAIHVVSTFLRKGEVVSTGGRYERRTSLPTTREPLVVDVPLVVLVNDGSASASEILAGALRDHNRAIVLGDRTFGKGSVQRVLSLGREARLKLTTALYYLPNGRSPHKEPDAETWGIEPDWKLELTPKEQRAVIKRENESYIIHNENKSKETASEEQRKKQLEALRSEDEDQDDEPPLLTDEQIKALEDDPVEALSLDPQLETALLLLRAKLAANLPWPRQFAAKTGTERK